MMVADWLIAIGGEDGAGEAGDGEGEAGERVGEFAIGAVGDGGGAGGGVGLGDSGILLGVSEGDDGKVAIVGELLGALDLPERNNPNVTIMIANALPATIGPMGRD